MTNDWLPDRIARLYALARLWTIRADSLSPSHGRWRDCILAAESHLAEARALAARRPSYARFVRGAGRGGEG